ncbi:MAG: hypothetical protein HY778_13215 [Betaproteobacteria bacterium]|nr:hypothetical protein [Betaproteobacteria bacterium]
MPIVPVGPMPGQPSPRGPNDAALPLAETDTLLLEKLPDLHQDPFDRMLICPAIARQMTILKLTQW